MRISNMLIVYVSRCMISWAGCRWNGLRRLGMAACVWYKDGFLGGGILYYTFDLVCRLQLDLI